MPLIMRTLRRPRKQLKRKNAVGRETQQNVKNVKNITIDDVLEVVHMKDLEIEKDLDRQRERNVDIMDLVSMIADQTIDTSEDRGQEIGIAQAEVGMRTTIKLN